MRDHTGLQNGIDGISCRLLRLHFIAQYLLAIISRSHMFIMLGREGITELTRE